MGSAEVVGVVEEEDEEEDADIKDIAPATGVLLLVGATAVRELKILLRPRGSLLLADAEG